MAYRHLVIVALAVSVGLVACGKKKKKDDADKAQKPVMAAAMARRRAAAPAAADDMTPAQKVAACTALFAKQYGSFAPHLAKLGFKMDAAAVVKAYGADKPSNMKRCTALTGAQIKCMAGQPNPLSGERACKAKSLRMSVPFKITLVAMGVDKALAPAAAKKIQAWLTGKWVVEDKVLGTKEVLTIKANGDTTIEHFKKGKPGKKETTSFIAKMEGELSRKDEGSSQTHKFVQTGPKTFHMVSNALYNVLTLKDKKAFTLSTTLGFAIVKGDACELVRPSYADAIKASCTWEKDAKTKAPIFLVKYKAGSSDERTKYFVVKDHLIHEHLMKYKYVRQ